MKDVCKMYEMKMNNLVVDVEIFRKETLFQAEFQQHMWSSFSQINFDQTYFGGFCLGVFCPGDFWQGSFGAGCFCLGGLCPRFD